MSTNGLRGEKEVYFKRIVMHCRYCRQDTLFKKHMVLAHHRRECLYLLPPGLQADDGEGVDEVVLDGMELDDLDIIEDRDILESPRLHISDNFEDLLGGEFGDHPDGLELETVDHGNRPFV